MNIDPELERVLLAYARFREEAERKGAPEVFTTKNPSLREVLAALDALEKVISHVP
jgi:hypothetical protein